jgi:hypothetical protein
MTRCRLGCPAIESRWGRHIPCCRDRPLDWSSLLYNFFPWNKAAIRSGEDTNYCTRLFSIRFISNTLFVLSELPQIFSQSYATHYSQTVRHCVLPSLELMARPSSIYQILPSVSLRESSLTTAGLFETKLRSCHKCLTFVRFCTRPDVFVAITHQFARHVTTYSA